MKYVYSKGITLSILATLVISSGSYLIYDNYFRYSDYKKIKLERKEDQLLTSKQKKVFKEIITKNLKPSKNSDVIYKVEQKIRKINESVKRLKHTKSKEERKYLKEALLASKYEIGTLKEVLDERQGKKKIYSELFKGLDDLTSDIDLIYQSAELEGKNLDEIIVNLEKKTKTNEVESNYIGTLPEVIPPVLAKPNFETSYVWSPIQEAHAAELLLCEESHFTNPTKPEEAGSPFLALDKEIVKPNQEILDLAASLKSPLEIYKHVKNNVRYELYFGAKQNAKSVHHRKKAGPYDQASYLISLLRAAGIA